MVRIRPTTAVLLAAVLLITLIVIASYLQRSRSVAFSGSGSGYDDRTAEPLTRSRMLRVKPDVLTASLEIRADKSSKSQLAEAKLAAERVRQAFVAVDGRSTLALRDVAVAEADDEGTNLIVRGQIDVPIKIDADFWDKATLFEKLFAAARAFTHHAPGDKKDSAPHIAISGFVPQLRDVEPQRERLMALWAANAKRVVAETKTALHCIPTGQINERVTSVEEIELSLALSCPEARAIND